MMRPLTTSELLDIWQEGSRQPPIERTLRLVGAACGNVSIREVARLSIGERDLRLLQLREWFFGTRLHNVVNCPLCSAVSEWDGELGDLRLQAHRADDASRQYACETEGYRLYFRLPNSEDLWTSRDVTKILTGCILSVEGEQGPCAPEECPATVLETLAQAIEREDPQADIRFTVRCPSCDHAWETNFDIGSYLWAEIDNWARRTLEDVYLLARHFGWSEQSILTMAPRRRQLYLQFIGS
jgi:hypothetical protein